MTIPPSEKHTACGRSSSTCLTRSVPVTCSPGAHITCRLVLVLRMPPGDRFIIVTIPASSPILWIYQNNERQPILEMIEFWKSEATIAGKLVQRLPPETLKATSNHIAEMMGRLSGTLLDYEKLTRIGLPGLRGEVQAGRKQNGDLPLYTGMEMALDLLTDVIKSYQEQAKALAAAAEDELVEHDYLEMAAALEAARTRPPETLREAAQLTWLYTMISGTVNYGRMDVYLGGFYAADVDSGRLSEAEALRMMQSLWQLIADRKTTFNGRVFIGGRGRPDEASADRFAMLAMEATRTVIEIEPQLTLRFYQGMNPVLMAKALDMLGEGRTFPMLFNDDVNIPAVENGFGVPTVYAEQYLPYGCGEYCLDHLSFGSPNCSLNLLKALEAVLHHGVGCSDRRPDRTGSDRGQHCKRVVLRRRQETLWMQYSPPSTIFSQPINDR